MSRYARQICLPEIGATGQDRLAAAKVLVAGAGGLGATVLPLLAGAGIGCITLYDGDHVEEHNLHRQTLFRMDDLGQPKAPAATRHLRALNGECQIRPVVARLDPANARAEIAGADLVIDAADNFATSYALSDLCRAMGKPFLSASVLGRQGHAGGFCGSSPSLRAVFPDPPSHAATCATAGVMGPAVATLGAIQAQMALSVLLNLQPSPLGQIVTLDFTTWRFSQFRFEDAPEPENPFPEIVAQCAIGPHDRVIDLRTAHTLPVVDIRHPPDQRIVFLCSSGLRAWRAARQLANDGYQHVAICADGM
ncbi:HesA/MoeB/ThiF family protein [Thioclava indica]|uniref:Rhodanese domain-containing protein n=1 Tax=Thioclava indica TaxID=1353528 RepID=A0A074J4D9_9RHOB|nr:HesA/MoeB/ThiF family protein [Thioclava indica]KEO51384.1 hypothetical protein DT23_08855 [Thioclava indica]